MARHKGRIVARVCYFRLIHPSKMISNLFLANVIFYARRQDAGRIALFAARGSKLPEPDFRPAAGPNRHSCRSAGGKVSRDHGRTDWRILRASPRTRRRQQERFAGKRNVTSNAWMGTRELKAYCALDEATLELFKMAMNELKLSARGYDRILKVARTIAGLAGSERLTSEHISEAIQYRSLDRQLWA